MFPTDATCRNSVFQPVAVEKPYGKVSTIYSETKVEVIAVEKTFSITSHKL